ncbi:Serine/threonine-protein kinase STY17 [Phytophthora citrophthora]|uniref:Serine/threonine-protein kinase STY17 n=1 Tax=Phytophthora citrophthora TaxID=4793 RepID=A0AAD9GXS2_9STRA|nr:Serine/threonine-protein kinase STY17 [Phytophthora citrophthora]
MQFIALLVLILPMVSATTMSAIVIFSDSQCNGTPVRVFMTESSNCSTSICSEGEYNGGLQYRASDCVDTDRHQYVAQIFNGVSYVTLDHYAQDGCTNLTFSSTYLAAGTCQSGTTNATVITKLYSNGSASIQAFNGLSCGVMASNFTLTDNLIADHTCVQDRYKFYSSTSDKAAGISSTSSSGSEENSGSAGISSTSSESGISTGGIIAIAIGSFVLAVLCITAFLCVRRHRRRHDDELMTPSGFTPSKGNHQALNSSTAQAHSVTDPDSSEDRSNELTGTITGMWDDEVIVAARLPREKVFISDRISRGGYGEVYLGHFNDEPIAVKMLLPETRKSISHVNEFLSEVKMMAMMEHPRITKFIGVAWDSLADLCVVSEYMAGGDLRALLNKYDESEHPKGFDKTKVQIALHVAHALTYMHSLEPSVIHRDLKSKNILLNEDMDAKLTDFGISRERVDQTMTAGVGTSLWMAPEVMLGEKYDDKADIFSFGVVLSELDSHSLPYSHTKDSSNSDRIMPDAVILQQVMLGKLSVQFTQSNFQSITDLGLACVSINPDARPTSAEALGRLHHILSQEL